MLSVADIRHRIRSVQDTRQITKAMELISISKMKKATRRYENNLVYFQKVRQTIKDILTHSKDVRHPYMLHREGRRTAYVVIAGDKGMAGGYNKNVLERAWAHMQSRPDCEKYVFTIGQKAREFFERRNVQIDIDFLHATYDPKLADARRITTDIIELYRKNLMDEVLVVFTKMKSPVSQTPMIIKLLPLDLHDLDDIYLDTEYSGEIAYDPSPKAVLDVLVPQYIVGLMYATLVQAAACEHSARMLAMGTANKNADEMLETLSLDFNRARQSAITTSINEISSASILFQGE